jgi:Tfp pilus assembly protein PilF
MLAGLAFYFWNSARIKKLTDAPQRVAILPFENQTGDSDLDWPSAVVRYSLARQLEVLPRVTVFLARSASQAAAQGATRTVSGVLVTQSGASGFRFLVEDPQAREALSGGLAGAAKPQWSTLMANLAVAVNASIRPNVPPAPTQIHNDRAARLLSEALSLSDPSTLLAKLEESTTADPACGWCWSLWAEQAARNGGPPALQSVLARSRAQGRQLDVLSRARMDLLESGLTSDIQARKSALERIVKALPSDAGSLAQLAELYTSLRQFERAEATLRQAVALESGRASLWNSFGYALAYLGRYPEADLAMKEYERAEPASANPLDSRGEILLMAGRFRDAAKAFESAWEKDKDFNSGAALEKAALALWLGGEKQEAGQYLDRFLAARLQSGDPAAELVHARWEYLFGQTASARARLERVASRSDHPMACPASAMLALRYLAAGDDPAAQSAAKQALSLARFPGQTMFARFVADAVQGAGSDEAQALGLTARGEWQRAAELWKTALAKTSGASDGPHRELLALALALSGRAGEARALVANRYPILGEQQILLYDFILYPNLFYVRAELAKLDRKPADAQRQYDLFLQYAGDRPDRFGQLARARAAARL